MTDQSFFTKNSSKLVYNAQDRDSMNCFVSDHRSSTKQATLHCMQVGHKACIH